MDSRYSFSLTTFSPSGKLVQIEYALNAVNAGATALGIKGIMSHGTSDQSQSYRSTHLSNPVALVGSSARH
jgi:hypothetical protein